MWDFSIHQQQEEAVQPTTINHHRRLPTAHRIIITPSEFLEHRLLPYNLSSKTLHFPSTH